MWLQHINVYWYLTEIKSDGSKFCYYRSEVNKLLIIFNWKVSSFLVLWFLTKQCSKQALRVQPGHTKFLYILTWVTLLKSKGLQCRQVLANAELYAKSNSKPRNMWIFPKKTFLGLGVFVCVLDLGVLGSVFFVFFFVCLKNLLN